MDRRSTQSACGPTHPAIHTLKPAHQWDGTWVVIRYLVLISGLRALTDETPENSLTSPT